MLAAVLGLAVVVFAADRLLLGLIPGRPDEATASPEADATGLAPEPSPGPAKEVTPGGEVTLATRLEKLARLHNWDAANVHDAFCPPQSWLAQPPARPAPADSDEVRARAFLESHKLTATAVSGLGSHAIIDGRCVTIGQKLDGFVLVAVDRGSAVLVFNKTRVRLALTRGASGELDH